MKTPLLGITFTVFFLLLLSCNNQPVISDQSYQIPPEIETLPYGTTLGLRAPEIVLPDTAGEMMSLTSLRGKVVLIDFWAVWCNPCRKENPFLVSVYKKYNDASFTVGEEFEIFSVSLDRNAEAWKEAIEVDKLEWPYILGDMQGAKTQPAQDYGIQMIPANFLLDRNGVIIASNLRGETLEAKLKSLLKEE